MSAKIVPIRPGIKIEAKKATRKTQAELEARAWEATAVSLKGQLLQLHANHTSARLSWERDLRQVTADCEELRERCVRLETELEDMRGAEGELEDCADERDELAETVEFLLARLGWDERDLELAQSSVSILSKRAS